MDKFSFIYNLVKSKMDSWGGFTHLLKNSYMRELLMLFSSIIRDGIQKISV